MKKAQVTITFVFLVHFLGKMVGMGTLVGTVLQGSPLTTTALVVGVEALAALVALGLARSSKLKSTSTDFTDICLMGVMVVGSGMAAILPLASAAWFPALFVREVGGLWLLARLAARLGNVGDVEERTKAGRSLQTALGFAWMAGITIAPVVASHLDTAGLLALDAVTGAVMLGGFVALRNALVPLALVALVTEPKLSYVDGACYRGLRQVAAGTFLAFGVAGCFHTIEVPILTTIIGASDWQISAILGVTALAYTLAVRLIKPAHATLYTQSLLWGAGAVMLGACTGYVDAKSLPIAFGLVLVIGLANGIFGLAQTTAIQKLHDESSRASAFLLMRLMTNLGLLASALLVVSAGSLLESLGRVKIAGIAVTVAMTSVAVIAWLTDERHKVRRFCQAERSARVVSSLVLACLVGFMIPPQALAFDAHIGVSTVPSDLHPAKLLHSASIIASSQVFETLYEYDDNNALRPVIADGHSISPDGLTVRIKVKAGKSFSDGTRMTAVQVAAALKETARILGKDLGWAFGEIEGYGEAGREPAILAPDDRTVEIHLIKPFPRLFQVLCTPNFAIFKLAADGKQVIGSGPYTVETVNAERLSLKRRSDLGPEYSQSPEHLVFHGYATQEKLQEGLLKGEIDVAPTPGRALSNVPGFRLVPYEYFQSVVLVQNMARLPKWTGRERCELSEAVRASVEQAGYHLVPLDVGLPFGWHAFAKPTSPKKDGGTSRAPLTILYADSAVHFDDAQLKAAEGLLTTKGWKIRFRRTDIRDVLASMQKKTFDAAILGYVADYLDPDAFLSPELRTAQQYNFSSYSDPTVDSLLTLARSIAEPHARQQVYREVFERVGLDCPVTFLGHQPGQYVIRNSWKLAKFSGIGFNSARLSSLRARP